jgi:hypothetical protein
MANPTMSFAGLERTYDQLAQAIDSVGEDKTAALLAKLAMLLAHQLGDEQLVADAIVAAAADL